MANVDSIGGYSIDMRGIRGIDRFQSSPKRWFAKEAECKSAYNELIADYIPSVRVRNTSTLKIKGFGHPVVASHADLICRNQN